MATATQQHLIFLRRLTTVLRIHYKTFYGKILHTTLALFRSFSPARKHTHKIDVSVILNGMLDSYVCYSVNLFLIVE